MNKLSDKEINSLELYLYGQTFLNALLAERLHLIHIPSSPKTQAMKIAIDNVLRIYIDYKSEGSPSLWLYQIAQNSMGLPIDFDQLPQTIERLIYPDKE